MKHESTKKQLLITGVNGFVGHHLARAARQKHHTVIGVGREASCSKELTRLLDKYISCDLTNKAEVRKKVKFADVDAIINLAGLANVGASFGKTDLYNKVNVDILENLCELTKDQPVRILAISTGAVYSPEQEMPISESGKIAKDSSPYAVSKLAMEKLAQRFRGNGQDVVIARPFNHVGPGQLPGFLVPDLANQVLKNDKVTVGNLKTSRDYTDVRDVVKAYLSLATGPKPKHSIYNICSGKSVSGEKILELIAKSAGKSPEVVVNKTLLRPNDPAVITGDNSLISKEAGWQPEIPIEKTISDFIDWLKSS